MAKNRLIVLALTLATPGAEAQRRNRSIRRYARRRSDPDRGRIAGRARAEARVAAPSVQNMSRLRRWLVERRAIVLARAGSRQWRDAQRATVDAERERAGGRRVSLRSGTPRRRTTATSASSSAATASADSRASRRACRRRAPRSAASRSRRRPTSIVLTIAQRPAGSSGSFVGLDAIELMLVCRSQSARRRRHARRMRARSVIGDAGLAGKGTGPGPGAKLYRSAPQQPRCTAGVVRRGRWISPSTERPRRLASSSGTSARSRTPRRSRIR